MKNFDDVEKELIACLKKKDFESLLTLDGFCDAYSLRGSTAKRLVEKIFFDFDEDDLDTQEKFYLFLDRIIDGICQVKYKNYRKNWDFTDVNQINDFILNELKENYDELDDFVSEDLTHSLIDKIVQDYNYFDDCFENILLLLEEYKATGKISEKNSIDFYNELLNRQRNNCITDEKSHIIKQLCNNLPYTKRKETSRIIGAKIKKIDEIFKNHEYEKIGVSEEKIREELKDFSAYLSSLKDIKKENIIISQEHGEMLTQSFLDGNLTVEAIQNICPGLSVKGASIIFDKYTQKKMKYLSLVNISQADLANLKLGYNYNNYKIVSKDLYYKNISNMLYSVEEKDALKLIEEADSNKYIFLLVFFINYFQDLNEKSVVAIIKNYSRIMRDFGELSDDKNILGLSFDKLYSLSEAYNHADDFTISVLGFGIVDRIIKDNVTSNDPQAYLKVYLEMLARDKVYIPPVSGEFGSYYYESAHDSDCERLMIGKNHQGSCIGIGGAGQFAFLEALTGKTADVIIFKDKNTHEFMARSMVFRAGNYVVLAPIYDREYTAQELYRPELLSEIASQMLNKSREAGDNLDYVFATHSIVDLDEYFEVFEDDELHDAFPHADLEYYKYLIGTKYDERNVSLNPDEVMMSSYDTIRDKVRFKDEVTNNDLNKIRALDVLFMKDKYLREDKMRNFEFIDKDDFDELFVGQDWYVGIKNGRIVDKKILPVNSERQQNEIMILCKSLISHGIVESIDAELFEAVSIDVQSFSKK